MVTWAIPPGSSTTCRERRRRSKHGTKWGEELNVNPRACCMSRSRKPVTTCRRGPTSLRLSRDKNCPQTSKQKARLQQKHRCVQVILQLGKNSRPLAGCWECSSGKQQIHSMCKALDLNLQHQNEKSRKQKSPTVQFLATIRIIPPLASRGGAESWGRVRF